MISLQTLKDRFPNRTPYQRINNIDPTRTITLRKQYQADLHRRFKSIFKLIRESVATNDCFGLNQQQTLSPRLSLLQEATAIPPRKFEFKTNQQKIEGFMEWLEELVDLKVLKLEKRQRLGRSINESWQNIYLDHAYQKGIRRARQELRKIGIEIPHFGDLGIDPVRLAFNQPIHADRIGVIYTRAYSQLKGITATMDTVISRALSEGLLAGLGADDLADILVDSVDKMTLHRATLLARTETINAFHKATIQTYRNAEVSNVKVKAEFSTAHDSRVCQKCKDLEKNSRGQIIVYTLAEIENMIPVHPQCRCIALPIIEDIPTMISNSEKRFCLYFFEKSFISKVKGGFQQLKTDCC